MNVFNLVQHKLKKCFTLDPFADNLNKKCNNFYSKYWCENSAGVDAFAYSWSTEHSWIVPPPKLVSKVLQHARVCHAKGVLIVPKWYSAAYWPLLRNGDNWVDGVSCLLEYVRPTQFFTRPIVGNNVFSENIFLSNVLVLGIRF